MKIRQEKPAEYRCRAFNVSSVQGIKLDRKLASHRAFYRAFIKKVPTLFRLLVSETDQGKLTGHIMSSKAKLRLPDHTEKAVLTVGPLSVHPEAQNTGVGSALINSVQKAKELGIGGLIILGHPTYYTKFGFVPATTFQITLPEKETSEALLAEFARLFWHKWWEWHFSTCFAYPETHLAELEAFEADIGINE